MNHLLLTAPKGTESAGVVGQLTEAQLLLNR